jgi:ABC-type sulfate transport system permease component
MSATPISFIIPMQVTLVAAAAATALNIWLGSRIALVLQPG